MGDEVIDEDVDVARERRRIETTATEDDVLVIQGLTKVRSYMISLIQCPLSSTM